MKVKTNGNGGEIPSLIQRNRAIRAMFATGQFTEVRLAEVHGLAQGQVRYILHNRLQYEPLGTLVLPEKDTGTIGNNAIRRHHLDVDDVADISRLWQGGETTQAEIAEMFGISQPAVSYRVNKVKQFDMTGNSGHRKLHPNDVLNIFQRAVTGEALSSIADAHSISERSVRDILLRKTYKDVEIPSSYGNLLLAQTHIRGAVASEEARKICRLYTTTSKTKKEIAESVRVPLSRVGKVLKECGYIRSYQDITPSMRRKIRSERKAGKSVLQIAKAHKVSMRDVRKALGAAK